MLDLPSINAHDAEPLTAENAAYQRKLVYRADDYSSLRYKLLQHLEEAFPNWNRELAARQRAQDFGVSLIEMFSYTADILGFYQNCRANEAFLRTATLRASLIELCALIDYRIPPGASAAALQAFLCKPAMSGTIPLGFKIKTKPQAGTPALTFETSEDLDASADLNQLHFKGFDRSGKLLSAHGFPAETSVLLDEGYAGLKSGQFVVVTCPAKAPIAIQLLAVADEGSQRRINWKPQALRANLDLPIADVVILGKSKQQMQLAEAARANEIAAGQNSLTVDKASIFNLLPDWPASSSFPIHYYPAVFISEGFKQAANIVEVRKETISWTPGFNVPLRRSETLLYAAQELVAGYSGKLQVGETVIPVGPSPRLAAGDSVVITDGVNAALNRVASIYDAREIILADALLQAFPNGAYVLQVFLPGEAESRGKSPQAQVLPILLAANTKTLVLEKTFEGLLPGQTVVITDGARTTVEKLSAVDIDSNQRTVLTLAEVDNRDIPALGEPLGVADGFDPGDLLLQRKKGVENFKVATTTVHGPFELQMRVDGYNRATGTVAAGLTNIRLAGRVAGIAPGRRLVLEDANGAEGIRIVTVTYDGENTDIDLEAPLTRDFSLADTSIWGNVVEITHGQSVIESALGSGDQSQANQAFKLHQDPTTFVHDAAGANGVTNTLKVFVGDEEWKEVDTLADSGPDDHHVMVTIDEKQSMSFMGGDGRYGAKFPTNRDNISARYRFGLGAAGNVDADSITVMAAPLPFLQSSRNPVPSNGGTDPQEVETTRRLAPVMLRTIDRAVTVDDYRDLALSYAGISKARARALQLDGRLVIDVVVATAGGRALNSVLRDSLTAFLQARSVPNHLILIRSFTPVAVRLVLEAHILPNYLRTETGLRIQKALGSGVTDDGGTGYLNFDRRGLGEDLYLSDVYAMVEGIEGVDFLIVKQFCTEGEAQAGSQVQDVVQIPPHGIATGGDPLDAGVGILPVTLIGGIS